MPENELGALIHYLSLKKGFSDGLRADRCQWSPGALPHGRPTERAFEQGISLRLILGLS